jgi:hypothetical protein
MLAFSRLTLKELQKIMTRINQNVEVNSFYFSNGRSFKSFPQRVTLGDTEYSFRSGLQMMVRSSGRVVRLFQMTDGLTNYRLRQENDIWTLIGFEPAL